MSTDESTGTDRPKNQFLNLCRPSQIEAYETAKDAIRVRDGGKLTEGEVVEELARVYLKFHGAVPLNETVTELVDDHASQNGDPEFTKGQLEQMDSVVLRNLAATADTDALNGRSTRLQMYGYFLAGGD